MRTLNFLAGSLLAALCALPATAQIQIGSPTIDRAIDDALTGLIYIYLGQSNPLAGPGSVGPWSFYDNEPGGPNKHVTPLLFQRTGTDSWKIVSIGTTRSSNGSGKQSYAFDAIAGSTSLVSGVQYTIGFTHRGYTVNGTTLTPDAGTSGVVDFDGYSIFTDPWAYIVGTAEMNLVVGSGGLPLDSLGFGGRIYSAEFEFQSVVPVAGCTAKNAALAADTSKLSPGGSFHLNLSTPSFAGGVWLLYVGTNATNGLGCGANLPGFGEVLFQVGSQVLLGSGALAAGAASLPLTLPAKPALIGKQILFQGLVAGVFNPGFPLELSNGLFATIAP